MLYREGIWLTLRLPSAWNLFWLLRVTDVNASLVDLDGWFITLMSTLMFPAVQSWHSTKMFSVVPTRSKLGADSTWLQNKERKHHPEAANLPTNSAHYMAPGHWIIRASAVEDLVVNVLKCLERVRRIRWGFYMLEKVGLKPKGLWSTRLLLPTPD